VLALHQPGLYSAGDNLLKELLKQIRFLKSSMPVLGKRRVVRNFLVEAESREPAPRQMHAQLFRQFPLARDAVQIADQQLCAKLTSTRRPDLPDMGNVANC